MNARLRFVWMALLAIFLGLSGPLPAEPVADDIWLVSTRGLPYFCCGGSDVSGATYWRLGPDRQWIAADQASFLATGRPTTPTCIVIHGNRSSQNDAVAEGYQLLSILQCQTPQQPLRLVIWSWPADPIAARARQDAQVKASRSDGQSCYLAQLLGRMNPQIPVSMVGYSFGARIITGALHLAGGGEVAGQTVPKADPTMQRVLVRAMLVASAEDYDWLLPGHVHGMASGQAERLFITVNAADPVLKRYPMLYGAHGPQAMGFVGPACGTDKAELAAVAFTVGKTHDWSCYLGDPTFRARLPWYAFLQPSSEEEKLAASPAPAPIAPPLPSPSPSDARAAVTR